MSQLPTGDYVLGTGAAELDRLGLQHRVWRPVVLDLWQRVGISIGSRVLDVGCGPGFATVDLAEIVGTDGQVVAVDRSPQYLAAARNACQIRDLTNVEFHTVDLMTDQIPAADMEFAWCRWVALFVPSPEILVAKIAGALRPGGKALIHDYIDYSTFQFAPERKYLVEFVQEVEASWRDTGGDPNIARRLPLLLDEAGLAVKEAIPRVFSAGPQDYSWQWPARWIDVNLDRLIELGRVDQEWTNAVRQEFAAAEADPRTIMVSPMVLEIVAEKSR